MSRLYTIYTSFLYLFSISTLALQFQKLNKIKSSYLFASLKESDDGHVAIVGGGPSGLLLAHRLLGQGSKVTIFESRSDPRVNAKEGRAYALGIGRRGRTAIRSVDNSLWDAVKARGFECERFILYIGGFPIKLRDGDGGNDVEPSALMYQSDLCSALLDELDRRHKSDKLSITFNAKISNCDLNKKTLTTSPGSMQGPYDLIIGCDGVNSIVREAIASSLPSFTQTKTSLPGNFKVCRLDEPLKKIDPTSVCLVLPKSGSTTAFVEPTAYGPCILFASRKEDDPILFPTSIDESAKLLEQSFPLFEGADFVTMAKQLFNQKSGSASSVVCNTYHFGDSAVLVGDAAHATGGVSGQGVNSALYDSMMLANCLQQEKSIKAALLSYSKQQVPEGLALYDLSFGPKPTGFLGLKYRIKGVIDSLFRGRFGIGNLPLQTLLTTTLIPFAQIRRQKNKYYDKDFPTQVEFEKMIDNISASSNKA